MNINRKQLKFNHWLLAATILSGALSAQAARRNSQDDRFCERTAIKAAIHSAALKSKSKKNVEFQGTEALPTSIETPPKYAYQVNLFVGSSGAQFEVVTQRVKGLCSVSKISQLED